MRQRETQTVLELDGKTIFTGECPYCPDTYFHNTSRANMVTDFISHLKANHEFKVWKKHC